MKKIISLLAAAAIFAPAGIKAEKYVPSPEAVQSQKEFSADRFGIFIHWGIYSTFAQGEWFLNRDIRQDEYKKAAKGFYPIEFDAGKWADAFKDSGARYVCFTSRHHDGFSMWDTKQCDYNIVKGTPFKRDVVRELSDSLRSRGIPLHLYYSHIDWGREDYPKGRTGRHTGLDTLKSDWKHYYNFMNAQLKELLTEYGPIRAVWFDGWWDHDEDSVPFNWELEKQYKMIHDLQPGCLVGNNHHQTPFEGEDIQIFERDLPGENTAGLSGQAIAHLPLETCNTMNGMWGYKVSDTDYKDTRTLIHYLVKTAGMGANLLLNIGPQPDGELPEVALERLRDMGKWLRQNGETIYSTEAGDFPAEEWGTSTRKGNRLFVHLLEPKGTDILVPTKHKVKKAKVFGTNDKVRFSRSKEGTTLHLDAIPETIDYIIELTTD